MRDIWKIKLDSILDLKERLFDLNLRKRVINLKSPIIIGILSYLIGNFSSAYILGKMLKKSRY